MKRKLPGLRLKKEFPVRRDWDGSERGFGQSAPYDEIGDGTGTSANGCGAPVLVYLHGGAFLGGSAQEKCFDGSALAAQGMVVVTVNFRLGIFGYAAFPELEARDGHAGNYGMYDAYAA